MDARRAEKTLFLEESKKALHQTTSQRKLFEARAALPRRFYNYPRDRVAGSW
jgi:hypothetical protein